MRQESWPSGLRLHARIYLAVLSSVAMVALLSGLAWHLKLGREPIENGLELSAEVAGELLAPAGATPAEQEAVLSRWGRRTRARLTLFSPARRRIAAFGEPLAPPPPEQTESGTFHAGRVAPGVFLKLPDGRWLAAQRTFRRGPPLGFLSVLVLTAVAVAVAAWPISRRLTRRLEELEEGVEALGAGDLAARVAVEGKDEVAHLAASFNRAAERIEELVGAQRRLLANASHELRSPLGRMRVAAGLLQGEPHLKEEIARDVAELDGLVEEILLSSRLEAGAGDDSLEEVDVTALAAEECARAGAVVTGDVVVVQGSPRLLRRLLRNLLENARSHGGAGPVEVEVRRAPGGGAEVDVLDRGPGVPEELSERIFEPFFRLPGAPAGGAGLGLAITRQIARRHGGDVVCLPREGGGSRFRGMLPGTGPARR